MLYTADTSVSSDQDADTAGPWSMHADQVLYQYDKHSQRGQRTTHRGHVTASSSAPPLHEYEYSRSKPAEPLPIPLSARRRAAPSSGDTPPTCPPSSLQNCPSIPRRTPWISRPDRPGVRRTSGRGDHTGSLAVDGGGGGAGVVVSDSGPVGLALWRMRD
jgi:hypothetical protein